MPAQSRSSSGESVSIQIPRGQFAAIVGPNGIGKTTLCEQLATYATVRGGTTLVGHCYEEGSLSLPYLAFVEAVYDGASEDAKQNREGPHTGKPPQEPGGDLQRQRGQPDEARRWLKTIVPEYSPNEMPVGEPVLPQSEPRNPKLEIAALASEHKP